MGWLHSGWAGGNGKGLREVGHKESLMSHGPQLAAQGFWPQQPAGEGHGRGCWYPPTPVLQLGSPSQGLLPTIQGTPAGVLRSWSQRRWWELVGPPLQGSPRPSHPHPHPHPIPTPPPPPSPLPHPHPTPQPPAWEPWPEQRGAKARALQEQRPGTQGPDEACEVVQHLINPAAEAWAPTGDSAVASVSDTRQSPGTALTQVPADSRGAPREGGTQLTQDGDNPSHRQHVPGGAAGSGPGVVSAEPGVRSLAREIPSSSSAR